MQILNTLQQWFTKQWFCKMTVVAVFAGVGDVVAWWPLTLPEVNCEPK